MKLWWRIRRILLFPVVDDQMNAILGIFSFVIFAVGIWIILLNLAGLFLTVFGFVGSIIYMTDYSVRRFVMRHVPIFEKDIRPEDFLNAPHVLTSEYRFAAPSSSSESQLYPYIDLSHDSTHIRAENDLTWDERMDLYKRWYSLCPHGFLHLEKLVGSQWRPIAVSIMLPLSPVGFEAITLADKKRQSLIIDLGRKDIETRLRRHGVLLIDTWIVDRAFKGIGHGKIPDQGGFANALILRHLALFCNVKRFPQITFLVETDNKYLFPMLLMFTFRRGGISKIGEPLYQVETSMLKGLVPEKFKCIVAIMRKLEVAPIEAGTTVRPANWTKTFGH